MQLPAEREKQSYKMKIRSYDKKQKRFTTRSAQKQEKKTSLINIKCEYTYSKHQYANQLDKSDLITQGVSTLK